MARLVRTNFPLTQLPKGPGTDTQRIEGVDVTVTLSDEEFLRLPSDIFTDGALDDLGAVADGNDAVVTQAATVAAPSAMTAVAATGGDAPTEAEYNALRTDVSNLRTTVANLITALRGTGKPMV